MNNLNNNRRSPDTAGVMYSLKKLAVRHRKKLVVTFFLVVAENVMFLLYPVLAGIAINAILAGKTLNAALYGLMVLCMWIIGATRRSVDTRTFARIYAGLAVSVVLSQRKYQLNHSAIAARVTLSREYVDFFEMHLPLLITSLSSLFGAAIMLLFIEFWAGDVRALHGNVGPSAPVLPAGKTVGKDLVHNTAAIPVRLDGALLVDGYLERRGVAVGKRAFAGSPARLRTIAPHGAV